MPSFYFLVIALLIQLIRGWRSSSDWHANLKVAPTTDATLYGFGVYMAEMGDVFLVGAPGNNEVDLYASSYPASFPNASVAGVSESTFVFPISNNNNSNNNTAPLSSNFKVWSQAAVLRVPSSFSQGTAATSGFGCAMSMSMVMSTTSNSYFAAVGDFSEATGTGSVYTFASTQKVSLLTFQSKLVASDAIARSYFGNSVAFSNIDDASSLILAVGANGALQSAGAVYVFASQSSSSAISSWSQIGKLIAHDGSSNDNFGRQIAITKSSLLVVSAYGYKGGTGCVYLYNSRISGSITSYSFASRLSAPDATPGSAFGFSLSATSDFVLVGTSKQASTGTAYLFCNSYGKWIFSTKLLPSAGAIGDAFGGSVAISEQGLTAIVGAFHANNSIGTIYLYTLKALHQQAASFVYEPHTCAAGASWTQTAQLFAKPKGVSGDKFGRSIAISSEGKDFVVGSYFENSLGIAGPGSALAFRDYTPDPFPLLSIQGLFSVIAAGVLLGLSFFISLCVAAVVKRDRQDRVTGVLEDKAKKSFRQRLQATITSSINPPSSSATPSPSPSPSPPPSSSDDVHVQVDALSSLSEAQTDPLDHGGALIEFRTRDYVFDFMLSIMLGSTSWCFIYILMYNGIELVAVIIFFLLFFQLCPFLAIVSEIVRGARVLPRFLSPGISPRHLKLHPVSWTWTCLLVLCSSLVFSLNLIRYLPWRQTVFAVTSRGYPTYRSFKYCELSSCSLSVIQIIVHAFVLFAAPTKLAMQKDLVVNGAFVGLWSLVLLFIRFFYSFFVYVLPLLSRGRGFRTWILETIAGTSSTSSSSTTLKDGDLRVDNGGSSFSYTEEDDLDFFPNDSSAEAEDRFLAAREEVSLADLRETENETRDRILTSNKKKWKASTTRRGIVETNPFHAFHAFAAAGDSGNVEDGVETPTRTYFSRFSLEREQQRGERLLQVDVERKGLLVAAKPITIKERLENMRPAMLLGDNLEDGDSSGNSSSDCDEEVVINRKLSKRK